VVKCPYAEVISCNLVSITNFSSPWNCATLLPVKYSQISGEPKIFLKSGQNFTGKSVAQVSVPGYYFRTNCRATYKHCTHPDTETSSRFRAIAMPRQDRFRGTNIQKSRNSQTMQEGQALVQALAVSKQCKYENKRLWKAIQRVEEDKERMAEEKDEEICEMKRKLFVLEQEREEKDEEISNLKHLNHVQSVCASLPK
jgi:hypothetical protein